MVMGDGGSAISGRDGQWYDLVRSLQFVIIVMQATAIAKGDAVDEIAELPAIAILVAPCNRRFSPPSTWQPTKAISQ